ncbi:MAG: glycosyltransferase family 39 protein [Candidatus Woesearchaeota archaeon]|nr:glycosyltransferase family 39 protein [Candidatus Woesearchaeota archaeon]
MKNKKNHIIKKGHYILFLILSLVLFLRLFLAFQTPYLTGSDAYFVVRQVESIRDTGFPIYNDTLSYGGRINIFMPFYYYILAFFSLFMQVEIAAKIIPNVFAALVVVLVYLISKEITKDENASLFSAFIAGFIPIFFRETMNNASPYAFVFLIMLLCTYFFLKINRGNNVYYFLISLLIFAFSSPFVVVFLFGLLIYIALIRLENIEQERVEIEVILFSVMFVVWFMFIIYKKAFLEHGISIIWQNIPKIILKEHFSNISILSTIYQIGSLPLSYSIYSIYEHLFKTKERKFYVVIGLTFSAAILIWLKMIETNIGFMFIGIMTTLLFPKFYCTTFEYLKKTRFARLKPLYFAFLLLIFIIASVIPSVAYGVSSIKSTIKQEEYAALEWLKNQTDKDSVVLSTIEEGHYITAIAKRKNVADKNFLLQNDAEQRVKDIEGIYASKFETEAVRLLNKYNIGYIYFSNNAKKEFNITDLKYTQDSECFDLKYNKGVQIYKVKCRLE